MSAIVILYSQKDTEIKNFLDSFYETNIPLNDKLTWEKHFENPIEIADIIGVFVDNNDKYNINMWVNLDENFFLNVNEYNANQIIRYLFERYPY